VIDSSAEIAPGVLVGPYAVVGPGARIGAGSRVGANVIIHAGTIVGAGCEIQDGAVLGKPPRLARTSTASTGALAPLEVRDEAVVCCQAIVFAGALLGPRAIVGDQAYVRERALVGPDTVIGRGSTVDNDVRVGARVRVQTDVYLTAYSVVEDDVFIGPGVCTTNDSTMSRHDASLELRGAVLRRACRVGGGVVLCPGVEVGEEAYVAAGAVVTRGVPERAVVMGVPARVVRSVGDEDLLERWR
jgi:acetyltransferase-like isoleucine patch superfamily enzyme